MTGKGEYNIGEEVESMMNDRGYMTAEEKIKGFATRIRKATKPEETRILEYELDQYFEELDWEDQYLLLIFEDDFNRLRKELSLKAF